MWRVIRSGTAILCGCLAVVGVCLLLQREAQAVARDARVEADGSTVGQTSYVPGRAYVLRFDPAQERFYTFTVPTLAANPHDLEVVDHAATLDVWFSEPGADRIGRFIYTNTMDHVFREYPVTQGSVPLNLVADGAGNYVWFTARQGNWIGRLAVSSGEIVTFPVPTAGSKPAGIDVAPDGSVWFAEMAADQIGRLVMTTTTDYEFTEYAINGSDVGAYGIAVQTDNWIWFTERNAGAVKRLKVADGTFLTPMLSDTNGTPYALFMDSGRNYLWLTERDGNRITQVELTTLTIVNSFPITPSQNSRPTGLTVLGGNRVWFSGQGGGLIGRMVYTSPIKYDFKLFDLPVDGLWAMDIAADADGYLWTVAYSPQRVFLPLTMAN